MKRKLMILTMFGVFLVSNIGLAAEYYWDVAFVKAYVDYSKYAGSSTETTYYGVDASYSASSSHCLPYDENVCLQEKQNPYEEPWDVGSCSSFSWNTRLFGKEFTVTVSDTVVGESYFRNMDGTWLRATNVVLSPSSNYRRTNITSNRYYPNNYALRSNIGYQYLYGHGAGGTGPTIAIRFWPTYTCD